MEKSQLETGTIVRTVFVLVELVALIVCSIVTFSNDGTSEWGYWGAVAIVFITLSPIIVYVVAGAIFNVFNVKIVFKKRHTLESVKKYHKLTVAYLIWGIITGALYGFLLVPVFFLENIFLLNGYKKELERLKNI